MSAPAWVRNLGLKLWQRRRELDLSLRELGTELTLSPSTLSRIERGVVEPDTDSLFRICNWLGISPNSIKNTRLETDPTLTENLSTPDIIEVHLRADSNLPPAAAQAIAAIVRAAYNELTTRERAGD